MLKKLPPSDKLTKCEKKKSISKFLSSQFLLDNFSLWSYIFLMKF